MPWDVGMDLHVYFYIAINHYFTLVKCEYQIKRHVF